MEIRLPHNWKPRDYQLPLWNYLDAGGKRAIAMWHRRAGKDDVMLHRAAIAAVTRPAAYWHALPEYAQARKAIWTAVNPHTGKRRIDEAFPREIRASTNEQEMFIRFVNGSTWQIVGSDRYDSLVGSGVAGVTFSEFALANPAAWAYIRPMLAENNGWACMISTPRGNNHAKALFDMAERNDGWFAQRLTVHDTGALTQEQLTEALEEYIALHGKDFGAALFEQEYLVSWSGAMLGAYWGAAVNRMEAEGRLSVFEIDPAHPVHTAWDLGQKAVTNPVWCFQVIDNRPRVVDFYQGDSENLEDWVQWLDDQGYKGTDFVPHDIMVTEWGSTRTRLDMLQQMGRKPVRIPKVSLADGITAGAKTIDVALFRDCERVRTGIEGLRMFRREWLDDLKVFRETPVKDWAEHVSSAFRYLGLSWREVKPAVGKTVSAPKELVYELTEDGRVVGNLDVRSAVEAMIRRKRRQRR